MLNRLNVSVDEFLYIHQNYKNEGLVKILESFFSITSNYDTKHIDELTNSCDLYLKENENKTVLVIKSICEGLKRSQSNTSEEIITALKDFAHVIWDDLSSKDDWYYLDLRLLNNLIFIFPLESIIYITKELEHKISKYDDFKDSAILIASLKLNLSAILMLNKKKDFALKLLNETLETSKTTKRYDFYLFSIARIGVILGDEKYIQNALKASALIDSNIHNAILNELEEFNRVK